MQTESKEIKKQRDYFYALYGKLKKEEEELRICLGEKIKIEESDRKKLESKTSERQKINEEYNKLRELSKNNQKDASNSKKKFSRKDDKRNNKGTEFKRKQQQNQTHQQGFRQTDPILLCKTLIEYLNRQHKVLGETGAPKPGYSGLNGSCGSLNSSFGSKSLSEELSNCVKKNDVYEYFPGAQKANKKRKFHCKKNQLFKISPEMLEQFQQLNITQPLNVSDIPSVISKLEERMVSYLFFKIYSS